MTLLVRGKDVVKRPVVTLAGEDVAQVKDVVYGGQDAGVLGFTLAGRGLFSGPQDRVLPWSGVHALGPHAVVVRDETAFSPKEALAAGSGGAVLGARVLTEEGALLGTLTDVVLQVDADGADVVGYEVEATEALDAEKRRVLLPQPDTGAVSGEALVVPARAAEYVAHDLAGFGSAVSRYRDAHGST